MTDYMIMMVFYTFSVCQPFNCFLIFPASGSHFKNRLSFYSNEALFELNFLFFILESWGDTYVPNLNFKTHLCIKEASACWYFTIILWFFEYLRLASHMVQWAF